MNAIKTYYWSTSLLALFVLLLNVGLGLFAIAIILFPIIVSHFISGFRLQRIEENNTLIFLSATNFLVFALIRPDGAHAMTDTGFTSILNFIGFNIDYHGQYESLLFISSLSLLFLQIIFEVWLMKLIVKK